MDFKSNLNRIHYLLSEKFENVEVVEKANPQLGSYIEMTIKENVECKMLIRKLDLEQPNITFLYLTNPTNENSVISRVSSVENFAEVVKDIFVNKRFDSDYLESVK